MVYYTSSLSRFLFNIKWRVNLVLGYWLVVESVNLSCLHFNSLKKKKPVKVWIGISNQSAGIGRCYLRRKNRAKRRKRIKPSKKNNEGSNYELKCSISPYLFRRPSVPADTRPTTQRSRCKTLHSFLPIQNQHAAFSLRNRIKYFWAWMEILFVFVCHR